MPFRRILLHIMLWSLGVGAVLGALAVLAGGGEAFARISGTTLVTAAAAGLLIPLSKLVDKATSRPAGLLGMSLVIAEFLLALVAIWELVPSFLGDQESVLMTVAFLPVCGTAAAVMLRIATGDPRGRLSGIVGIAIAVACFVLIMGAAWIASGWQQRDKLMGSSGVLAIFGLLLVAGLAGGVPWPKLRPVLWAGRAVGAAAAVVGATIALYAIWYNIHESSGVFRAITSVAAVVAHANLCLLVPLIGAQKWVRVVAVAAGVCTAFSLNIAMAHGLDVLVREYAERAASAAGIITCCGSLALVVLACINRRIPSETRELPTVREVRIFCPGCGRKPLLAIGRSTCPTCRLQFEIRVREPRCPKCDYLLFMLASDRCPECGESVLASGEFPGLPAAAQES
jgi:hypothetical protein